ncbi:hypothetical protein LCGC14_2085410 [marine sediment metagenome]|uniref:Uncharacterized protein n=1 Tax=marine sediment metagenome TaxID=412755 RepID=A0A0F9GSN9_9ZZZZ
MSEMVIVECDYRSGECLERFEGFRIEITDRAKHECLTKRGWLVRDGKHYCPKHREQILTENNNGKEENQKES